MTIHCITSFRSRDGEYGYVLGSDSRAEDCFLGEVFDSHKHFLGKTFLGLIRGSISRTPEVSWDYNVALRSLDEMFENICSGANYSHLHVLQQSDKYALFIAKREDFSVNLFTVSNYKKRLHRAKEIGRIDPLTEESTIYLALNSSDYFVLSPQKLYDFDKAFETVEKLSSPPRNLLDIFSKNYEPGPANVYVVSSKRIGKVS